MATNKILLDVQAGQLPTRAGDITRQQFFEDMASRLIVRFPTDGSTFGQGAVVPSSEQGPFFQSIVVDPINGIGQESSFRLLVWSSSLGTYVPLAVEQSQLRYWVGSDQPSASSYLVWFETNSQGELQNVKTYNRATASWVATLARLDYTRGLFADVVPVGGVDKGRIDWSNVLNRPNNIIVAGETGLSGNDIVREFNYQKIWHTGINAEIVFIPAIGGWSVTGGSTGDLKFVTAQQLGAISDFNLGQFFTALGRNPGWVPATDEEGRVLVAAAPSLDWSSLTALKIEPGSTFGAADHTLTAPQSGLVAHNHSLYGRSDAGSSDKVEGFGTTASPGDVAIAGEVDGNKALIKVNADTTQLIGTEGDTTALEAHNNIQPSIARFLLRKV